MISRNGLLTKAATFYCPEHGEKYTNIVFEFGRLTDGISAFQYSGDFFFRTYEKFEKGYKAENDIAYVRFPELIGDQTGWYRCLIPKGDSNLKNATLLVRANKSDGFHEKAFSEFERKSEKILKLTDLGRNYGGDPVLIQEQNGDGSVIGIVVSIDDDDSHSYVRRITTRVRNDMYEDGLFKEGNATGAPTVTTVHRDDPEPEPTAEPEPAATPEPEPEPAPAAEPVSEPGTTGGEWTCPGCGQEGNTGAFCTNCGTAKPAETAPAASGEWTCPDCGQEGNTGAFCPNCGKARPAAEWTCPNCGQEGNQGAFCPNCGTPRSN